MRKKIEKNPEQIRLQAVAEIAEGGGAYVTISMARTGKGTATMYCSRVKRQQRGQEQYRDLRPLPEDLDCLEDL